MRRPLLSTLALLLSVTSLAAENPAAPARPALTVLATTPQPAQLPMRVTANGNIAAWQESSIGSEANGLRLDEVRVNVGDAVKKGQVLAVFAAETVVADLADLSSAQASGHSLRWESIDLAALVRQECDERAALVRAAELDLHLDAATTARVRGDRMRLHQVVGNLLENCVRHCRPGDSVTVRVESPAEPDARGSGIVRLTVRDSGPGIDEADLPHVTTRFWRSSRARDSSVGSGLGLAIVAELVRAHQGRIEVTSPSHQGTVVTVELPVDAQPPAR